MGLSRRLSMSLLGFLLVVVVLFGGLVQADSQRRNPVSYLSEIDEPRIRTPQSRAHAHSSFDLLFSIHGGNQDVKLTLHPNQDLIPDEGIKVDIVDETGKVLRTRTVQKNTHRIYKGESWLRDEQGWYHAGWARIVLFKDGARPEFEGAFSIAHDAHHIQLRSTYLKTKHAQDPEVRMDGDDFMVVWKDSDIKRDSDDDFAGGELRKRSTPEQGRLCPSDNLSFNAHPDHPLNSRFLEPMPRTLWGTNIFGGSTYGRGITKRQTIDDDHGGGFSVVSNPLLTIGSTDGCPRTRQIALIGIATDCTYTAEFDDEAQLEKNVVNILNTASQLYEKSFNISLALGSLQIQSSSCPGTAPESAKWNLPCRDSTDIDRRLDLFSEWRGKKGNDGMAMWMLLTTCETGNYVGLAWLGQVCKYSASIKTTDNVSVSGALVVARTSDEWRVIAHEIGHMFGANHDCLPDRCPGGQYTAASKCCPLSTSQCSAGGRYMMNPTTSEQITDFSPCTIGALCSAIKNKQIDTSCLTTNRNVKVFTKSECGNGIVEPGEECDCGGVEGCAGNSCCDPTTCKYTAGSVCDDLNEECCSNCQFAPSTRVCRPSDGECDPEERCTGSSSLCPKDEVKKDGSSCGDGLKCASGQCTSRDQQCRTSGIVSLQDFRINDTTACNNDICMLGCRSPSNPTTCVYNSQTFLDGTPCKGDGFCRGGKCTGSTTSGQILSWINSHKPLVIGVAVGVGVLLLLALSSCIWSRCCGRRSNRRKPAKEVPASRNPQWQPIPSTDGVAAYPMPPPLHHNNSSTGRRMPPPPPPPATGHQAPPPAYYDGNNGYPPAPRWG